MARLTNSIAEFLMEMLDEEGGMLEIQRNNIAEKFSCAPSQINYVLTKVTMWKAEEAAEDSSV